jgi:hemerythrin
MPILEWTDKFNLGIEQFDTNHRHMVQLLNKAHDDYLKEPSVERLAATLNEFFEVAGQHFDAEEKYMEDTDYVGYAEHLVMHRSFTAQIEVMQKDLKAVWKNLPLEMLTFLKNWLTYDILNADADYVRSSAAIQWQRCA